MTFICNSSANCVRYYIRYYSSSVLVWVYRFPGIKRESQAATRSSFESRTSTSNQVPWWNKSEKVNDQFENQPTFNKDNCRLVEWLSSNQWNQFLEVLKERLSTDSKIFGINLKHSNHNFIYPLLINSKKYSFKWNFRPAW